MTKQEIIAAAFKVWGRNLYQSTSLSELARELQVSKAALYRHFKHKQALLQAMSDTFFDEYTAFIKPQYERAVAVQDSAESFLIMMRSIVEYYIRHRDAFIFSIVRVYGDACMENVVPQYLARGIDLSRFREVEKEPSAYPSLIQLIIGNLSFMVGYFHRPDRQSPDQSVSDTSVRELLASMEGKISRGLGLDAKAVARLDYENLESRISRRHYAAPADEGILKAVAEAVAEAGPWKASMDMVARKSGLSKSSLYSRFKNRQDMLKRLFMTEFDRVLGYVEEGITLSSAPEEQLYLAVFSAADYLRSRSEILLAADWIRTRNLNLGIAIPPRLYRVFSDIKFRGAVSEVTVTPDLADQLGQMILFLIVHTLMRRPAGMAFSELPNLSIRRLFRFIALGLQGFTNNGI
jgi:AcrR family transcriptional regulator